MHIFGVPIDNLSTTEVFSRIEEMFDTPAYHRIATINPEFLLLAQENSVFRTALLDADLRLPDGVGLSFAFWLSGESLRGRFPGADLLLWILDLAEAKGLSVALFLRPDGLSDRRSIVTAIQKMHPSLSVVPEGQTAPLVLSNFGAPLQEIFLASLRRKAPDIRLAIGVGGALDFVSGALPRAPRYMRQFGMEWLWRLLCQPKRLPRIFRAVLLFPIRLLFGKINP